jgi:hypothetical protein
MPDEFQQRITALEKAMEEVAEVLESYQDPEIATTGKLHKYARVLRKALNDR